MKKILYAVYGSNLLKERFMVYIKGGDYRGRIYKGCRDKSDPKDYGYTFVSHRLYFAKRSSRWKGGVAFLTVCKEPNENYHALVRLWKITEDQFKEIWDQEGRGFYKEKLYLGEMDGMEIYTITGDWLNKINEPAKEYIEIVKTGLKETTGWDDDKIEEYITRFVKGENHVQNA